MCRLVADSVRNLRCPISLELITYVSFLFESSGKVHRWLSAIWAVKQIILYRCHTALQFAEREILLQHLSNSDIDTNVTIYRCY